jgi:uncharacterized protein with GYD domain
VLAHFTEQGIRHVKDTVKRAEALKTAAKKLGATLKEVYWTLGPYDMALLVEAPDEATATALGLHTGAQRSGAARLIIDGDEQIGCTISMKLSEWARKQGISYQTAWRWVRQGKIQIPFEQTPTGTILVKEPKATSQAVAPYARRSSRNKAKKAQEAIEREG